VLKKSLMRKTYRNRKKKRPPKRKGGCLRSREKRRVFPEKGRENAGVGPQKKKRKREKRIKPLKEKKNNDGKESRCGEVLRATVFSKKDETKKQNRKHRNP